VDDMDKINTGIDRRTMLKAAVATGVIGGTWVAPRIETLGFAPAAAATMCPITNDAKDDLNSNDADTSYVSAGFTGCGQSFGNSGQQQDTIKITFVNPVVDCDSITVGTIPVDCPPDPNDGDIPDPDISGFAVVIVSSEGTACGNCTIQQATIHSSTGGNNRGPLVPNIGNPFNTPYITACGTGVLVNPTPPCSNIPSDARLAVTLLCSGVVAC
jgi:hypothetical protein